MKGISVFLFFGLEISLDEIFFHHYSIFFSSSTITLSLNVILIHVIIIIIVIITVLILNEMN
jgi:hypothetical protein